MLFKLINFSSFIGTEIIEIIDIISVIFFGQISNNKTGYILYSIWYLSMWDDFFIYIFFGFQMNSKLE